MAKDDKRIIEEEPPIATIEGWEDGQPFKREIHKLDRWALQSADTLTIHIGKHDIVLVQDPHSNYLGGYIWLTSIVFCSYLERLSVKRSRHGRISLDHNKRWVELGSGVGLIGIMLHKLGIEEVVITDIEELIPTMEKNVEANSIHLKSLSGRRKNEFDENYIVVDPLFWNNKEDMDIIKSGGDIDYIVACDCIYSEASAVDLVKTMEYLSNEKTTIICISEVRNQAAQDKFMLEAKARFQVELLPAIQWQKKVNHQVQFDETLNLYRLRKPRTRSKSVKNISNRNRDKEM